MYNEKNKSGKENREYRAMKTHYFILFYFLFSPKDIFSLLSERERERERERDIDWLPSHICPDQGLNRQSVYVP